MNSTLNTQITDLEAQIQILEQEVSIKTDLCNQLKAQQLKETAELYPLASFVGHEYLYDRPFKWNNPRLDILEEADIEKFDYLKFNGIFSGKEINTIYFDNHSERVVVDSERFVMFAIKDDSDEFLFEDAETVSKPSYVLPIPLDSVYTILLFKLD